MRQRSPPWAEGAGPVVLGRSAADRQHIPRSGAGLPAPPLHPRGLLCYLVGSSIEGVLPCTAPHLWELVNVRQPSQPIKCGLCPSLFKPSVSFTQHLRPKAGLPLTRRQLRGHVGRTLAGESIARCSTAPCPRPCPILRSCILQERLCGCRRLTQPGKHPLSLRCDS